MCRNIASRTNRAECIYGIRTYHTNRQIFILSLECPIHQGIRTMIIYTSKILYRHAVKCLNIASRTSTRKLAGSLTRWGLDTGLGQCHPPTTYILAFVYSRNEYLCKSKPMISPRLLFKSHRYLTESTLNSRSGERLGRMEEVHPSKGSGGEHCLGQRKLRDRWYWTIGTMWLVIMYRAVRGGRKGGHPGSEVERQNCQETVLYHRHSPGNTVCFNMWPGREGIDSW